VFTQLGSSYNHHAQLRIPRLLSFRFFFMHLFRHPHSTGQDNKENHIAVGVQGMQGKEATMHQANQALRVRREEGRKGQWILNAYSLCK
jgi:hypothetical protein